MTRSTIALTLTFLTFAPLGCLSVLDLEGKPDDDGTDTESGGTEVETDTDADSGELRSECEIVACCLDTHGAPRPVQNPALGDIVFSEIMANPGVALDEVGEWVEFRIREDLVGSVDLNNLQFGRLHDDEHTTLSPAFPDMPIEDMPECLEFEKGDYVVLGRQGGWTTPGLESEIDALFDFSLLNYTLDAVLYLRSDETTLDIQSTYVVSPGAAWSRDESTDKWCFSTVPYTGGGLPGEADLGTPGAANSSCAPRCRPGDGGSERNIRIPEIGQILITEFRAAPPNDRDDVEWLEIYNLDEETSVDLNGLRLHAQETEEFEAFVSATCLEVKPGGHAIVASKPALGELTPIYVLDAGTRIVNFPAELSIRSADVDNVDLACIIWSDVEETYGYATSLDPMFYQYQPGCWVADDGEQWCWCEGTPGAENTPCPPSQP